MKLVVFFRYSISPHIISGEAELLMATVRFALIGVCYICEIIICGALIFLWSQLNHEFRYLKSVSRHGNVYDILDSTNINSLENCLWNQPRKRMPTIMKSVHRTCFTSHCSTRFLWLSTNVTQILRGVNAKLFYLLHYLYALRTLSHSPLNKSR